LQLRQLAADASIQQHYSQMAEAYFTLAETQEAFADLQEQRDAAFKRRIEPGDGQSSTGSSQG
jgi:hypothetical protein